MVKNKNKSRWLDDEIRFGKELADYIGVDYDEDEWYEYEEEDEDEVDETEPMREGLMQELRGYVPQGALADALIPGAAPDDVALLLQQAESLAGQIAVADLQTLSGLAVQVATIGTDKAVIVQAVRNRQEERKNLQLAGETADIPANSDPDESEGLANAKGKVHLAVSVVPFSTNALELARQAVEDLQKLHLQVTEAVKRRGDTRETYRTALALVTELGYLEDQKALLLKLRGEVDDALKLPATTDGNGKVKNALDALEKAAIEVAEEIATLGGTKELEALATAFGASELRNLIKEYGSAAALDAALKAVGGKDNLAKLSKSGLTAAAVKKLCDDMGAGFVRDVLAGGVKPEDISALHSTLGTDVVAFQALAKDGGFASKPAALVALFIKGCGGNADKFKALCAGIKQEDLPNIKGLIETGGLGDAPDALAALFATGCGGDPKALVQLGVSFGDQDSRAALNRMLNAGGLKGQTGGDGDIDPKCLALMLRDASGPALKDATPEAIAKHRADGLAALFKGMNSTDCTNFKTSLTKGGLGTAPEALAQTISIGCDGKAAQLKAFATTFANPQNAAGLKQMLNDGGMKGKAPPLAKGDVDPSCLGQMLKHGAGNPAGNDTQRMGKIATLMKGMGKTDCQKFGKVLSEGGLGQAPEAMAHLVGIGCGGDAAKLKSVNTAFAGQSARDGLARMLDKGAMKGKVDPVSGQMVVDPTCLAYLLTDGAGDRPTSHTGNEATRRATALGNLCAGMDDTACLNLGKALETGGLGAEPKVLGKLVGTGCGRGDPVKLNALTEKLAISDNNVKLASLLQAGGFGTKGADGKALTPEDDLPKPECLALLFSPGCDDDPAELVKLLQKLDATACANLKGVMMGGSLGQHPKVLGDVYRNGCLDDPYGPANGAGAKNPDVLLNMVKEFSGGEAAKFKELMDGANLKKFDDAKGVSRLGSVMRYAFSPRGGKQKPEDLKKLHTGFNGHMADLGTMMTRLETAPDWMLQENGDKMPNQPGKALQNIRNSPKHFALDDPGKLYSDFFVPMEAYTPATGSTSKAKLMQTAASFEHRPVQNNHKLVTMGGVKVDLEHVLLRHSRESNTFIFNPNLNPIPDVTLYPRKDRAVQIGNKVQAAIAAVPNSQRPGNANDLGPNGGLQFTVTSGSDTHLVGYKRDPNRNGLHHTDPSRVMVGQCYPKGVPDQQKVKHVDMMKMKSVLH